MATKRLIVCACFVMANCCNQVLAMNEQPFAASSAMTTVLARPLGGYGLTPLVFEPTINPHMESSSSNSVATKVRKSPVYELIMPNFDDETLPNIPVTTNPITGAKTLKKLDYESIVSSIKPAKLAATPTASSHSISSSTSGQSAEQYFSSMLDMLKMKDSSLSYNSVSAPSVMSTGSAGYSSKGGPPGGGSSSSFFQQQPFLSDSSYGGGGDAGNGPHTAAIQSMRSVHMNEVQDSYDNAEPQVIDIPPSAMPIVINFRTSASQIQIHQSHEASEPKEVQETQSQDEPHFLRHSVTKPVIQEVHEIIMPYRRIIQEIRPVEEEIKTIVARNSGGKAAGAADQQLPAGAIAGGIALGGGAGGGPGAGISITGGAHGLKKSSNDFSQNALQYAMSKLTSGGGGGGGKGASGNKYKSS